MEQFNVPHQRVREKSVYFLHLDTARIVLISAAVIGIVIVSFLLGMNFTRGGGPSKTLVTDNDIFDGHKGLDLLKNNAPETIDEDELASPLNDKLVSGEKDDAIALPNREAARTDEKTNAKKTDQADLLTKDTVGDTTEATKEAKPELAKKGTVDGGSKKLTKADGADAPVRAAKKSATAVPKKRKAASRVIEVSGVHADSGRKGGDGRYSIQVASYDGRSRAEAEVRALKDLRYDAYLDETRLKGRPYYRVRVGQISSRKRAIDILKDIQERERYQDSYLIRE